MLEAATTVGYLQCRDVCSKYINQTVFRGPEDTGHHNWYWMYSKLEKMKAWNDNDSTLMTHLNIWCHHQK